MLAQNLDARSGDTSAEAEGLRLACIDLLRELEAIDPMRRARYEDLCESLGASLFGPLSH